MTDFKKGDIVRLKTSLYVHTFNRGDLVKIIRTEKNTGRGFNTRYNEHMGVVIDGKYSWRVQVQLFTGDKITVWPEHLKIVRRAQGG